MAAHNTCNNEGSSVQPSHRMMQALLSVISLHLWIARPRLSVHDTTQRTRFPYLTTQIKMTPRRPHQKYAANTTTEWTAEASAVVMTCACAGVCPSAPGDVQCDECATARYAGVIKTGVVGIAGGVGFDVEERGGRTLAGCTPLGEGEWCRVESSVFWSLLLLLRK